MVQYAPNMSAVLQNQVKYARMSVSDWVNELEMDGRTTFSLAELSIALPNLTAKNISNSLWRLTQTHRIALVQKAFYVIVPPANRRDGLVSPYYYIDNLMRKIGREYYVGLLTAASLHGAAHQAVMTCDVVIPYPRISFSRSLNSQLNWHYRPSIPLEFLERRKTDTGYMSISNPELTAFDLIQHSSACGGLSAVATILAELSESIDFRKSEGRVLSSTSCATIQRLGYILDTVIGQRENADALYGYWRQHFTRSNYVPLSSQVAGNISNRDKRWKVLVNAEMEVDEL